MVRMRNNTEARRAAYERQRRYPRPTEEGDGLCLCGCGQKAPIAKFNNPGAGVFAGRPVRYLTGHQMRGVKRGEGRYVNSQGYVLLRMPTHPQANKGYVLEHRWVMEQKLGRPLRADEPVHHMNHVKTDNRPENLAVLSQHDHGKQHGRPRGKRRTCGTDGCDRIHYALGLCSMHYIRGRRPAGDPGQSRIYPWRGCTVDGCGRKHLAKGLCPVHYAEAWRAQTKDGSYAAEEVR